MEKQQENSTIARLCFQETTICDHLFLGENAFTRFEHNLRLALLYDAVSRAKQHLIKDCTKRSEEEKLLLMTTIIPTLSSTLAVIAIGDNKYLARVSVSDLDPDYCSITLIEIMSDKMFFN